MSKTTNYKNITWRQTERKWYGCITVKGVKHNTGGWADEIEAVKSVDRRIISLGLDYRKLQILKPLKRETENN